MQPNFKRRFFELAFGVGLAQVVSAAFMPVISRMYTPSQMGEFAIFLALSGIAGGLAGLRLDIAVVLAKDEDESRRLVGLASASSLVVGLAFGLILFAIQQAFQFQWHPYFSLLVGVCTTLVGLNQVLLYWQNRHQHYRTIGVKNSAERLVTLSLSALFAPIGGGVLGLITAQLLGHLASLFFLVFRSPVYRDAFFVGRWRETWRRYSDFPRKNVLGFFFNTLSILGGPLLFAIFFDAKEVGIFSLASRVFELPITLVGNTFHSVYYQHISQKSLSIRRSLFLRSSLALTAAAILPTLALTLWGGPLFRFIFGAAWKHSGELALFLAPFTFVRLLFLAQTPNLLVERRLFRDLLLSSGQFFAQTTGFLLGYYLFGDFKSCVAMMCLFGGAVYAFGFSAIGYLLKRTQ